MSKESTAKNIERTEQEWNPILLPFIRKLFSGSRLPSHDYYHHRRVWSYLKYLTLSLAYKKNFDKNYTDNAIMAALFHDTGMIQTLGPDHGESSMKICRNFIENSTEMNSAYFEPAFTAIVNHDKKEYKEKNTQTDDLSVLLPIADDLDAFGRIGILRYYEIYYLRGIPEKKIPGMVVKNLQKRWEHFNFHFKNFKRIEKFHRNRFQESYKYYERLDRAYRQFDSYKENAVVELSNLLKKRFTGQSDSIQEFLQQEMRKEGEHAEEVREFLVGLQKELDGSPI